MLIKKGTITFNDIRMFFFSFFLSNNNIKPEKLITKVLTHLKSEGNNDRRKDI